MSKYAEQVELSSEEVKLCPFCGEENIEIEHLKGNGKFLNSYYDLKHLCPVSNQNDFTLIIMRGESREDVVNKWNKRFEVNV